MSASLYPCTRAPLQAPLPPGDQRRAHDGATRGRRRAHSGARVWFFIASRADLREHFQRAVGGVTCATRSSATAGTAAAHLSTPARDVPRTRGAVRVVDASAGTRLLAQAGRAKKLVYRQPRRLASATASTKKLRFGKTSSLDGQPVRCTSATGTSASGCSRSATRRSSTRGFCSPSTCEAATRATRSWSGCSPRQNIYFGSCGRRRASAAWPSNK